MKKPWGYKDILIETDNYTIARLHINPGERLSLQKHSEKVESLIVERNYCWIRTDDKGRKCFQGEFIHIPPKTVHRIEAFGNVFCDLIEIATMSDDEVIRIEDDYNRCDIL